ncbi:Tetratricopeptide repeat [Spirosomataceae bacterium]|jgi:tetratricopeptide (TPR) repeat protein
MQIIHKIDNFLYTIFPSVIQGDQQSLLNAIQDFYTYGPYKPKVTIDNDFVSIEIDTPTILAQDIDYQKVIAFCEKGKYADAKPILKKLIEKNPAISEYHRIMGQILSDEGDQEEAINCLIDALRWDSKNGWALLMMGNIFAKFKDDVPTAMKYYDQAQIANPKDNITINNIGANLMQQGKLEEAKKYFYEALKINNQYANTHFALGMIAEMEADLQSAFYSTIQAIKLNKSKDVLYQNSVRQAFEISKKIIATDNGKKIFREYRHKLEFDGDRKIDIIQDEEIPTAAKFEFAENYDRETHIVKYKPSYPAVEHLIMHELVHLDFVIEARKGELNQLFISTQNHKTEFIKGLEPTIKKFSKMGISEKSIADYCSNLFEGMNRQIFNTPIDLFIENFLYNEFAELRPFQFISLYNMLQEGLKAVTDKKIVELSPKDIISKSKVYNLVNAIQFKELFGFDFIKDFNATPIELKLATDFYDEYLQYKEDKEPAEEYELVLHWAEDLKLDKNFELINEHEYRTKRTDIDNLLSSIEKDPYDLESKDPYKQREMDKFQKSQEQIGINMAVAMFMVDALQFFEDKAKEEIKKIAFEIATQGTQGYRPDKDNYRINSIKDKTFSGYHILAYYYVSWSLAIPEMVSQLNLPYEAEYKMALTMHKPNKQ